MSDRAVTICSGGMDSATLVAYMKEQDYDQTIISFNYGQRHKKELTSAAAIAKLFGAEHHIVDISTIQPLLRGSSQTDSSVPVPEGHYSEDNMKLTVVPNRNAIMLSIAYGAAVAVGAKVLAYGAHAGDHFIYPDCRPEFVEKLSEALALGNVGFADASLKLIAPFSQFSKGDILRFGLARGVPYDLTWTCYKGGDLACGRCGCCVERLQAFSENQVEDPLPYEDREFWKQAIAEYAAGGRK